MTESNYDLDQHDLRALAKDFADFKHDYAQDKIDQRRDLVEGLATMNKEIRGLAQETQIAHTTMQAAITTANTSIQTHMATPLHTEGARLHNDHEVRIRALETNVTSQSALEVFRQRQDENRRWLIGLTITVGFASFLTTIGIVVNVIFNVIKAAAT